MKNSLILSSVLALLLSQHALCQPRSPGDGEVGQSVSATNDGGAFKKEVLRRIAVNEAAARRAEAAHASDVEVGKIYKQLGMLYEDAAQWERSEAAVEHAISLFRHAPEPSPELAAAISQLGSLHVAMGKLREGEKEALESMKLRERINDPLLIARSWNEMAALLLAKHKYDKAKDFGEKAVAELVTNKRGDIFDRIVSRYTLSLALCMAKDCASAIPLMRDAIDEAKSGLQAGDFPIGFGEFLLGYAYWKSGNMSAAGQYMREGTSAMSEQLGWGHPTYLSLLDKYAKFLRENKQVEAANVIERQIRRAESVVDVHSIQTRQGMFGLDGLR